MSKFKKIMSYKSRFRIWRLLADNQKLLIESRDTESKDVFFSVADAESGDLKLEDFQTEEKSWTGIEKFHKGIIYFHKYIKPDLPDHISISAFDTETGKYLWIQEDLSFCSFEGDFILASGLKNGIREYFKINPYNGEILSRIPAEEINALSNEKVGEEEVDNYFFPSLFNPDDVFDDYARETLENVLNSESTMGAVEYIIYKDLLLFNYFRKENNLLSNCFHIYDLKIEKEIYDNILEEELEKPYLDSFFIKDDLLYLLKGKNKVIIFRYKQK